MGPFDELNHRSENICTFLNPIIVDSTGPQLFPHYLFTTSCFIASAAARFHCSCAHRIQSATLVPSLRRSISLASCLHTFALCALSAHLSARLH